MTPALFARVCLAKGIPAPLPEHRFHPRRKWRFDYAWPGLSVALEIEGGIWTQGRHTRGAGFLKDMEKYNTATLMGWQVYRCTPGTLLSKGLPLVVSAINAKFAR